MTVLLKYYMLNYVNSHMLNSIIVSIIFFTNYKLLYTKLVLICGIYIYKVLYYLEMVKYM